MSNCLMPDIAWNAARKNKVNKKFNFYVIQFSISRWIAFLAEVKNRRRFYFDVKRPTLCRKKTKNKRHDNTKN